MDPVQRAAQISELLERQPLAGVVAFSWLALVVVFLLYIRENRAHQATLREIVTLTATITKRWEAQLLEQASHGRTMREVKGIVGKVDRALRAKAEVRQPIPVPSTEDPT